MTNLMTNVPFQSPEGASLLFHTGGRAKHDCNRNLFQSPEGASLLFHERRFLLYQTLWWSFNPPKGLLFFSTLPFFPSTARFPPF